MEKQEKKCFIITPIGDSNSTIFKETKDIIDIIIKPTLEEHGFNDIKPAYEIMMSGIIETQIVERILNDDLVIANLTGNNPNVMYELAIRHATAKPIIQICENGTKLPFNIQNSRTIFYENSIGGTSKLKKDLESFAENIDYTKEYKDNIIYHGISMENILKSTDKKNEKFTINILSNYLEEIQKKQKDFEYNGEIECTTDYLKKICSLSIEEIIYLMECHKKNDHLFTEQENKIIEQWYAEIDFVAKKINFSGNESEPKEIIELMGEMNRKTSTFSEMYIELIKEKIRNLLHQ